MVDVLGIHFDYLHQVRNLTPTADLPHASCPRLVARRALWWYLYFSHSSSVGGLVPTRLMSPFRIFKNLCHSSPLPSLIRWPMPMTCLPSTTLFPMIRGSQSSLNICHRIRDCPSSVRPFVSLLLNTYFVSLAFWTFAVESYAGLFEKNRARTLSWSEDRQPQSPRWL